MPDVYDANRNILNYRHAIFGQQFGVAFSGTDGNYVQMHILCEDDENWFISGESGSSFSNFWLPDLQRVLKQAEEWLASSVLTVRKDQWGWQWAVHR